jgi:small-conductance mechanosensitive channel
MFVNVLVDKKLVEKGKEESQEKEEQKEKQEEESTVYGTILGALRLFVFIYILVFALYVIGFDLLEGLVSFVGAVLLFGASLVAVAMEKL